MKWSRKAFRSLTAAATTLVVWLAAGAGWFLASPAGKASRGAAVAIGTAGGAAVVAAKVVGKGGCRAAEHAGEAVSSTALRSSELAGAKAAEKAGEKAAKGVSGEAAALSATRAAAVALGSERALLHMADDGAALFKGVTLTSMTTDAKLFTPEAMPELFRRHPEIKGALTDARALHALVQRSPEVLDDAAFAFYVKAPAHFARFIAHSSYWKQRQPQFAATIEQATARDVDRRTRALLNEAAADLAANGVDRARLGAMAPAKAERALCDALQRGFAAHAATDPFNWSCAEGDLVVSGDVGHFAFEQAASLANLLDLVASFDDAAPANEIAWRRVSFELAHPCIEDVCLKTEAQQKPGQDSPD